MDGTEHEVLSKVAGHFPGTGAVGSGNYCIAGHNSTIYAEIFNEMKHIEIGMVMYLIDNDEQRTKYTYTVTQNFLSYSQMKRGYWMISAMTVSPL